MRIRLRFQLLLAFLLGPSLTAGCLTSSSGDFFPPFVEITHPQDGDTVSGVVDISAAASDDSGIESVRFYLGATLLGVDEIAPYSWLWNTATVTPGTAQIEARVADTFGNTAFHRITVTVDNTPPQAAPY
ncbi:MAG TPA: Ig-like domain-containing protein [Acidimicrobiia bacterium]|jgi:hypothetical protein